MSEDLNMTRAAFLSLAAMIAMSIGGLALLFPDTLIETVKGASMNGTALVMVRTVGVMLVAVGYLAFMVRNHADSPTLRSVLAANLALQLMLLPIDPVAYTAGIFRGYASFVPNTLVHLFLASGFAYFLWKHSRARPSGQSSI